MLINIERGFLILVSAHGLVGVLTWWFNFFGRFLFFELNCVGGYFSHEGGDWDIG